MFWFYFRLSMWLLLDADYVSVTINWIIYFSETQWSTYKCSELNLCFSFVRVHRLAATPRRSNMKRWAIEMQIFVMTASSAVCREQFLNIRSVTCHEKILCNPIGRLLPPANNWLFPVSRLSRICPLWNEASTNSQFTRDEFLQPLPT